MRIAVGADHADYLLTELLVAPFCEATGHASAVERAQLEACAEKISGLDAR